MTADIRILDRRIAYGATCTWWDDIGKVGKTKGGEFSIPCCPHCGGILFEIENIGQWWRGVDAHEANGNPGYLRMIEFGRGKCYKTSEHLDRAFFCHEAKQEAPK